MKEGAPLQSWENCMNVMMLFNDNDDNDNDNKDNDDDDGNDDV